MSKKEFDQSRRQFLLNSTLMSASAVAAPFAMDLFGLNSAMASTYTGDYKALVCIFLAGGNDHNNMVLATDTPSWNGYLGARSLNGSNIALSLNSLLPITPATTFTDSVYGYSVNRSFALHPQLTGIKKLFDAGRAAIVANVGPLIQRIPNKSAYRNNSYTKPTNLFSHSDQTVQWQSTDSSKRNYGWGGRMADRIKLSNTSQNFTSLSMAGNTTFLAGETLNQYQINNNGVPVPISGFNNIFGSIDSGDNFTQKVTNPYNLDPNAPISTSPPSGLNLFEAEHAKLVKRAIDAQDTLQKVMTQTAAPTVPAPSTYLNPVTNTQQTNSLAVQLQTVARIIAGRNLLGAHRQIFYVTLSGFDTHDFQANNQAVLFARLSHALEYFDTTLKTLGDVTGADNNLDLSSRVTTFTASDFGRTFASNGDGTDHGWGAHHFVIGGAVKRADIFCGNYITNFPMTAVTGTTSYGTFDNPLDVGSGNTVPQISVDEYAATLAKWFGLTTGTGNEIAQVFPNLSAFDSGYFSTTDLGFI